jgi:hypothetical protein
MGSCKAVYKDKGYEVLFMHCLYLAWRGPTLEEMIEGTEAGKRVHPICNRVWPVIELEPNDVELWCSKGNNRYERCKILNRFV